MESPSLSDVSVRELKNLLASHGIDYSSCLEKAEMLALAQQHNLSPKPAQSPEPTLAPDTTPISPEPVNTTKTETSETSPNPTVQQEPPAKKSVKAKSKNKSSDKPKKKSRQKDKTKTKDETSSKKPSEKESSEKVEENTPPAHIATPSPQIDTTAQNNVVQWSVRELKELFTKHRIDATGCYEKSDLINLAINSGLIYPSSHSLTSKGKSDPVVAVKVVPQETVSVPQMPSFNIAELLPNLMPMVMEKLKEVKIDKLEDQFDAGKAGIIKFHIHNVSVDKVEINKDNIKLDMKDQMIQLSVVDIGLELNKFDWGYKQQSFPKLKSSGTAVCKVHETSLLLAVDTTTLQISECKVSIGKLKIKLGDTGAKAFYNILLSVLQSSIKQQLEAAFTQMITKSVQDMTTGN